MTIQQSSVLFSRIALFVIYFWFGLLKVLGQSPASEMVEKLLSMTMPFIPFGIFIVAFGLFEMLIGILFLIPGKEKWGLILFVLHMTTTTLPLFFMSEPWSGILIPTLEGQYIIKNLALIACALTVWTALRPRKSVTTIA